MDGSALHAAVFEIIRDERAAFLNMRHDLKPRNHDRRIQPSTHNKLMSPGEASHYPWPKQSARSGWTVYLSSHAHDEQGDVVDACEIVTVHQSARFAKQRIAKLIRRGQLSLPHLVIDASDWGRGSQLSLELPHGIYDAYIRDSELEGEPFDTSEIGIAILGAHDRNPQALYRYSPADLVFGSWNSHRGGVGHKMARAVVSQIIAYGVEYQPKSGAKHDPFNVQGAKTSDGASLSSLGYDMIPPQHSNIGGITAERYVQTGTVNLVRLARYEFGSDALNAEAQTTLALLGLLALNQVVAQVPAIRTGAEFVPITPLFLTEGLEGEAELGAPSTLAIIEAIDIAAKRAEAAGALWRREPVVLKPGERFASVLDESNRLLAEGKSSVEED